MSDRRNFLKALGLSWLLPFASGEKEVSKTKEVPLFDFFVAGYKYYDGYKALFTLKAGDEVILKREPDNEYDDQAVAVFTIDGYKLGYVPMESNIVPVNIMDNEIPIVARVKEIDKLADDWEKVFVSVSQIVSV
jgi:intein/homing endonuclease